MGRPSLKLAEPVLSPERQALAVAIDGATPVRAEADKARTKAEAARGALAQAVEAIAIIEHQAEEAKAYLVENPHAERATLRAKRQAAVEATDDLAIARTVAERLEADLVKAERSERYAADRIATAADGVLVTSFAEVLAETERAGREYARLAYIAYAIAEAGDPNNGERSRLTSAATTLGPHLVFKGDGGAAAAARLAAVTPWRDARRALMADPAAPLPEV